MAKKTAKPIQQLINEQQLRIAEIEENLYEQTYFETMPVYGPTYKYCYATSNFTIPYAQQSVDNWVRAIIKHMAARGRGHGGEVSRALVISIPDDLTEENFEQWLSHQTAKIRKKATPRKRNKKK